jgi:hypothetical protein
MGPTAAVCREVRRVLGLPVPKVGIREGCLDPPSLQARPDLAVPLLVLSVDDCDRHLAGAVWVADEVAGGRPGRAGRPGGDGLPEPGVGVLEADCPDSIGVDFGRRVCVDG